MTKEQTDGSSCAADSTMPATIATARHLAAKSHAVAVNAGWWHDIETGDRVERNRGELLCLIHSEISEAFDAEMARSADDKLPHRSGAEVELADTFIRVCDYAGAFGHDPIPPQLIMHRGVSWAELHSLTSDIMELERKGLAGVELALRRLTLAIFTMSDRRGFDLLGAVREKLAYNEQRADHKPENRRAAGGKKF